MLATSNGNYNNFYDEYKNIPKFMRGLQLAEKIEEDGKEIHVTGGETDTHFAFHFILPQSEERWGDKYPYNLVFGIYCRKDKFQIVVKSSMMSSNVSGTTNMLTNNLTSLLRKKGFKNIRYDLKRSRGNINYPQIFVKILVNPNNTLGDIAELYEIMKEYNNKLHSKWMENNPF